MDKENSFTICCDWRFARTDAFAHGTGRFVLQQMLALLKHDTQHHYHIIVNNGDDKFIPRAIHQWAAEHDNLSLMGVTLPERWTDDELLSIQERFQHSIVGNGCDLYFNPAPATTFGQPFVRIDALPCVVNYYDAIPLIYPRHYPVDKGEYRLLMSLVRTADRLVCISNSAARDAKRHLGVEGNRTRVAYPFAEAVFHPDHDTVSVLTKYNIDRPYVLSVTGLHHSKNIDGLMQGIKHSKTQDLLVIAGSFTAFTQEELERMAAYYDIDLVIANAPTDSELRKLYNGAVMLIQASRYEGFGLPVLEALQCGTPVVCSHAASLPEVAGALAGYFDPEDVTDIARAIDEMQPGSPLYDARDERLRRAARFDEENLAQQTLQAFEEARLW